MLEGSFQRRKVVSRSTSKAMKFYDPGGWNIEHIQLHFTCIFADSTKVGYKMVDSFIEVSLP